MSIEKIYEIGCDECGEACHYYINARESEKEYREQGGIVTKDKKHYCGSNCYKKAMGRKKCL